jgi:hypothetical protein
VRINHDGRKVSGLTLWGVNYFSEVTGTMMGNPCGEDQFFSEIMKRATIIYNSRDDGVKGGRRYSTILYGGDRQARCEHSGAATAAVP